MKQAVRKVRFGTVMAGCVAALSLLNVQPASAQGTIVPGSLLVCFKRGAQVSDLMSKYHLNIDRQIPTTTVYRFHLPAGIDEQMVARHLSNEPGVLYAETEPVTVAPCVESEQFHFAFDSSSLPGSYTDQGAYQQIDIVPGQLEASGLFRAPGMVVAVLDTGATFTHPDLAASYLPGYNVIDPSTQPLDIPNGTTNLACGHGTMVAGIINKIDPDAWILPIKVLDADGNGTLSDLVTGIYYAISQGANVINMSLGSTQETQTLDDAIAAAEAAGIVVVASTGNDGSDVLHYPAACNGVIAVSSIEADNTLSSFSNYGSYVSVDAPGDGIRSTYYTGGYASWSGTSFAAPFVAGQASLMLEADPVLDAPSVALSILGTAHSLDALNPGFTGLIGSGVVDVNAAVGL